ncbi:PDZ domain-containing protein [Persephonella sp.]
MVRFNPAYISAVAGAILAVVSGISLSYLINGYLEYRFFTLPPENVKKLNIETEKKKKEYRYLAYILEDVPSTEVASGKKEKNVITLSTTDVKLLGTVKIGNNYVALISSGGKKLFVKKGDRINGYRVTAIHKYYIILDKDGRSYRINLSLQKGGGTFARTGSLSVQSASEKDEQIIKLDKRFVEEKTADIGKLMKDVLVQPVVKNGETIGFMFRYVRPNSLLYNLGLRSGDLIVSVNGRSIKTVEEAFKIYNILRNESRVEVVIKRRGKEKTLIFQIQ